MACPNWASLLFYSVLLTALWYNMDGRTTTTTPYSLLPDFPQGFFWPLLYLLVFLGLSETWIKALVYFSPSLFLFFLTSLWKSNFLILLYFPEIQLPFPWSLAFFFPFVSSCLFFRRPDFSLHVDRQADSSISLLEFKFLYCCRLSILLLIARVAISSFHCLSTSFSHFLLFFLIFHSFLSYKHLNEFQSPGMFFNLLLLVFFLSRSVLPWSLSASFPVMFFIALYLTAASVYPSILHIFFSSGFVAIILLPLTTQ